MNNKNNLILNSLIENFLDSSYFSHLMVCEDPKCNCGAAKIIVTKGENLVADKVECSIPINVHEKIIEPVSHSEFFTSRKTKQEIRDFFSKNLTKEDWQVLNSQYFDDKFKKIEKVNPDDITFEFSNDDLEDDSLMLPYSMIFPASLLYLDSDKGKYAIYEHYCKNPKCDCTDIIISVKKNKTDKTDINSQEEIGNINYDYQTLKINIKGKAKEELQYVFDELNKKYDNLPEIYKNRNQIIRDIYKKAKIKYHKEKDQKQQDTKYKNAG